MRARLRSRYSASRSRPGRHRCSRTASRSSTLHRTVGSFASSGSPRTLWMIDYCCLPGSGSALPLRTFTDCCTPAWLPSRCCRCLSPDFASSSAPRDGIEAYRCALQRVHLEGGEDLTRRRALQELDCPRTCPREGTSGFGSCRSRHPWRTVRRSSRASAASEPGSCSASSTVRARCSSAPVRPPGCCCFLLAPASARPAISPGSIGASRALPGVVWRPSFALEESSTAEGQS